MSAAAVLALLSGAFWGAGDFMGGLQARRLGALAVVAWSQVVSGLVLWLGLLAFATAGPNPELVGWGVLAGVCGGMGIALFYRAMALGAISLVAPVTACGVAIPVGVSLALGERPSALALGGIVLALAGVVVISLPPRPEHHTRMTGRVLGLALASAVGFAGFFVFADQAAGSAVLDAFWAIAFVRLGSLLLAVPLAMRTSRGLPDLQGQLLPVVAVGLLDTTANVLFAIAATTGQLAIVAVLGSLYPAVTVLLARAFLKERISVLQLGGVVLALVGVVAIAGG